MKKSIKRKGARILAMILTATIFTVTLPIAFPAFAVTTTYQASTSFNNGIGIQGKDQWYYQQFNGSSYLNLTWNNTNQAWYGTQTYLVVSGYLMHPESMNDAVRTWVSPGYGTIRIYGNVRKYDTYGGDGILATIRQNNVNLWATNIAYNDSAGISYDFTRTVKPGDKIQFLVNNAGTIYNDSTYWDPCIDFTPYDSGTSINEWNFNSGADGWTANYNCTASASGGNLNVSVTGADPSLKSADNLNIEITKSKLLKIRFKNSTNSNYGIIFFTTNDDPNITTPKTKCFSITPNDPNYTEYNVDMSDVYGWTGKLKQIRLDPSEASSGSYSIDYIKIQTGGVNSPTFNISDKEVIYTKSILQNKSLNYYADSNMGVIRNSNATYKFFSSNGGATQCTTYTSGTLEDPANTVNGNRISIANTPSIYNYVSAGPVYQDPTDANTIMSIVHAERFFTVNGVQYFDACLAIAISRNGGSSWTWCGEIIDSDMAYDPSRAMSLDIGGGSYLIQNVDGVDYFYVYAIDWSESENGIARLSVSRAPVSSVLNAAKNNTVTQWYKYYNGSWNQPAINGSFTSLCNSDLWVGFHSVSYNSYLNKYILAMTTTRQWGTNNWSDISLFIADSPTDFNNNTKEYQIDASVKYTQYPTIIGLGNSNPQTQTQKNFYIYYMQFDNDQIWGSDTNLVRKMIILD